MSRIIWDPNLFVCLLEDKGELTERVVALRERMVERRDELDAIQLACTSVVGVDMFITNYQRLSRRIVPGVHFIQLLASAALQIVYRSNGGT